MHRTVDNARSERTEICVTNHEVKRLGKSLTMDGDVKRTKKTISIFREARKKVVIKDKRVKRTYATLKDSMRVSTHIKQLLGQLKITASDEFYATSSYYSTRRPKC